jgi:hypothetical protein
LYVTAGHLARLVADAGGAIDGYGVLLAFPPEAGAVGIDVELSQIGRCVVDEVRRRVTVYPTMEGDDSYEMWPMLTIEHLVGVASSLIEDRSDYSVHMCRRMVSVDPIRCLGETLVFGTIVLHEDREVWLLPTEDRDWAVRAAAL